MLEIEIFGGNICGKSQKADEVVLVRSVSQPGHWRSISLFTPWDAQSDRRIFLVQLFIPVSNGGF